MNRISWFKMVYFKDGEALFAASNNNNDRLGEFLLSQGQDYRDSILSRK